MVGVVCRVSIRLGVAISGSIVHIRKVLSTRSPIPTSARLGVLRTMASADDSVPLADRHCQACSGGIPKLSDDEAKELVRAIPDWKLNQAGDIWQLSRRFRAKNFVNALGMCSKIADVAEAEGHHPDLHVTGYQMLRVDISTHAVGGLTENDFILAARIDCLDFSEHLSKKPQPTGLE